MANITIIQVSAPTGKLGDILKDLTVKGMSTDEAIAALTEAGVDTQAPAETEVAVDIVEEQPTQDETAPAPETQDEPVPTPQSIEYVDFEELVGA